ncbi:ABC transporter substrate-binding protein [Candidatus Epulonipiscium viviparus]|uniref:ABC transporter substrate-binding protein n=1 Tax=Candidatus Epulonipiscium viviparus TaxID=420336 RepID=UPI0027380E74|nr:hypothetical protein [Candidatus Epulopiscium viviparus]
MKKFALLLGFATLATGITGCYGSNVTETGAINKYTLEAFADVEPLAENVEFNVGALTGSTHGFVSYLIQKLGGYEHSNVDAEIIVFDTGALLVETMVAGDCDAGLYGLGGTLAGTIGQGFINFGAGSRDYQALQLYSPNDSEMVAAGEGAQIPGVYGTADDWRGKDVYLPVGSTLHYMLGVGLAKLGLSMDDIKITHMDVQQVNSALRSGHCNIGGLWTNYPYGDINETATAIMKAEDVDVTLVTCFSAPKSVVSDAAKMSAVEKWMELYFAAVDWMYANDENLSLATDWFLDWNDSQGVDSERFEIEAHLKYQKPYTLEENIEMFNTQSDVGEFSKLVEYNVLPLEFYVDQGSYREKDIATFLEPQYFDSSVIDKLAAK